MASIHPQGNTKSRTYRVRWRDDGRQQSITFADLPSAERFKKLIEDHGPAEAMRVLEIEEASRREVTVAEFLAQHIDGLTGVEPATLNRYKTYLSRDITPVMGRLPLTAVTEHTISKWVQKLQTEERSNGKKLSGKTIANMHGFLSGAFNQAVKQDLINANPCQGRRLPRTSIDERVALTPAEFGLLRDCIPRDIWKNLATWLVLTGMRFGEATALTPDDIDPALGTCRIVRSWKYTGTNKRVIGPPKTKKSVRTISLPAEALEVIDLGQPEWLFTNGAGNPVTAQQFYNGGWQPGREKAMELGLKKWATVHGLRHTCASWMVQAGIPLPTVQAHLGHESINTTIALYYHADQRQDRLAADAIGNLLRNADLPQLSS